MAIEINKYLSKEFKIMLAYQNVIEALEKLNRLKEHENEQDNEMVEAYKYDLELHVSKHNLGKWLK